MNRVNKFRIKPTNKSEDGIVAIMVTMVMMIVISLIVVNFAQISRREQRQALDNQLSTQAFYAAESGVNVAVDAIKNRGYTSDKPDCIEDPARLLELASNTDLTLDSASGADVKVSCLIIDSTPESLQYKNVNAESKVIPIQARGGTPINSIKLQWQDKNGASSAFGCTYPQFSTKNTWGCPVGVLRVDLVPTTGVLSRSSLSSSTMTTFLYPSTTGTSIMNYASGDANQGSITQTNCTGIPIVCTMSINNLTAANYFLRILTIYGESTVTITATNSVIGQVELIGAQAIIDSTGKANDVIKRIQVRAPISEYSDKNVPDFAVQTSGSICKKYGVTNTVSSTDGETACSID